MAPRAASPSFSEGGFDISTALARGPGEEDDSANGVSNRNPVLDQSLVASHDGPLSDSDDDEGFIAAQLAVSNRKSAEAKAQGKRRNGGFQSMGLTANLLKAIQRKGFSVPTPIQRKVLPLILDNQDVVGMARTGSGKTAAFVIPMLEKLRAHSVKVGARAIILSPSRELALQTLKTVKEFGRGTDLRSVLLVGGDRLEDQFAQMASNPDIIIATPGRFMHLMVEMSLDLSSAKYVVFDEADRLFEMGFATQLNEILHALPPLRQTLLFSATLPASLVEFAKAGLREPHLVRLDAESKISPDLQSAFLTVKSSEKEGALLHLLHDVIGMPTSPDDQRRDDEEPAEPSRKKRKRDVTTSAKSDLPTPYSTVVFAATKHHVEFLAALLRESGFAVSYVYGSLDQTARMMQVEKFRTGASNILVVTDVAARGIDIPMLANVINYNLPPQPKVFIHRVGRTARAGRSGWSYNLIQEADVPYLLDLQLFLGKELVLGYDQHEVPDFTESIVVGSIPRSTLENSCELASKLLKDNSDLELLRQVAGKGEKMYSRTKKSASSESAKRAKTIVTSTTFNEPNLLYRSKSSTAEVERNQMLAKISGFRPTETVFEIGRHNDATGVTEGMRRTKRSIQARATTKDPADLRTANTTKESWAEGANSLDKISEPEQDLQSLDDEFELSIAQNSQDRQKRKDSWEDAEHFMSYQPQGSNLIEDRGYGVQSGSYSTAKQSNFADAARGATMDLGMDESRSFAEPSRVRWDKRSKKYVHNTHDQDSIPNDRTIRGESGQRIAASFRSGRFDEWRKANRVGRLPKVGESEAASNRLAGDGESRQRFKHRRLLQAKLPDKYRDDYHTRRKKLDASKANGGEGAVTKRKSKDELRGVDDVRKARNEKQKRRDKNARPSRKRKN